MASLDQSKDSQNVGGGRIGLPTLIKAFFLLSKRPRDAAMESQQWQAKSYVSLIRTLVRSSGIYALASLASPLIALVLAPFLTHTLSHSDYGALAILITVIVLTAGITQFGLNHAFFRAYSCDYESQRDRLDVVSTLVVLLLLTSVSMAITAIIAAPWLANFLLNDSSFSGAVRLAALVVLLQNLTVPGFSWLRAENRAASYSALAIVNLLINLGATIVLVGLVHMGMIGALLASGCGYAVIIICTLPVVLLRAGLRLRLDITWNLLSFGLPLVSNFVAIWILQLSDRYLLGRLGSLAQTASYSVAYVLGGVMSVAVLTPFSLAWPSAMFAIARRDDAVHIFRLVFRWYSFLLLLAAFGLSLVAVAVLDLFFPPAYHSAAPVIPIVALSMMFNGIYDVFTVGVSIRRQTWFAVLFTTLAALVNIGFNIVLIPRYGSMGAAVSTLIAYAMLATIAYIVNQRIYPIPFEIGLFFLALLVGLALYMGSTILAQVQETIVAGGIDVLAFCLYCGCLLLLRRFSTSNHVHAHSSAQEGPVL